MTRTLSTAQRRTEAVLDASLREFAHTGYRGTPITAVAAAAGISQAYVFRLFPTKRELFVAALHECFDRILATLSAAVEDLPAARPKAVLGAMAQAYAGLIADRDLIMVQLHALAASDDEDIAAALRAEQQRLVDYVADRSRAGQPDIQLFFARGQLCHFITALNLDAVSAPWAALLTDGMIHPSA